MSGMRDFVTKQVAYGNSKQWKETNMLSGKKQIWPDTWCSAENWEQLYWRGTDIIGESWQQILGAVEKHTCSAFTGMNIILKVRVVSLPIRLRLLAKNLGEDQLVNLPG